MYKMVIFEVYLLKKTVDTQILEISMIMGGSKNSKYRYVDRNKPSYIAIKIKLVQKYLGTV